MSKALPDRVNPLRLARHGESLAGSVVPAQMPRLAEMLHKGEGRADFELRFGHDDAGQACVLGHIDAQLAVLCQRCLEPLDIHIERDVRLAVVRDNAEVASLDAEYDPLLIDDERVSLAGLLEDELILAMPDFFRHSRGECQMPPGADAVDDAYVRGTGHNSDAAGESGEDNPFLMLKSIKTRKTP